MYEPQCDQSPLRAYEIVRRFAARRGAAALRLAAHAALPQTLRPDLLHLLRLNFVPDAGPDGALEADVLFAPFCQDLGNGYYRFGSHARLHLLRDLDAAPADAAGPRSAEVARFLIQYLDQQGRRATGSYDRVFLDFLEIERWNALGFYDPQLAAQQLASALRQSLEDTPVAARLRFSGLASALAMPLAGHDRLLAYTAGLEALQNQDHAQARDIFQSLGEQTVELSGVRLPSPRQLAEDRLPPSAPATTAPESPAEPPAEPAADSPATDPAASRLPYRRLGLVYRHSDAEHAAKRLADFLRMRLPDIEFLPEPRWDDGIEPRVLDEETLLVVLIGPQWLLARDTAGQPRLFQTHDWLRRELEAAFAQRARVLPILLDGATMPSTRQLPESLHPLIRFNAIQLDASRWDAGCGRLIAILREIFQPREKPRDPPVEAVIEAESTTPPDPLDPGAGRVVLFVGHSVDRPHRPKPRFPPALESTVRQEIERWLSAVHHEHDGHGVGLGLASGSDGGDILFHEVCAELGIRTALFLPIDPSAFVGTLLGAGWNWMERFEALTRKPTVHVVVQENSPFVTESVPLESTIPDSPASADPWGGNARAMMERALARGAERASILALWNGEPGGPGGPADIIRQAEAAGVEVFVIDPRRLLQPEAAPETEARSSPTAYLCYHSFDQQAAAEVKQELEKGGLKVWDPPYELHSGPPAEQQIADAIYFRADYFVVLLSPHLMETAEADSTSEEVRLAFAREKRAFYANTRFVIPVELQPCHGQRFPELARAQKLPWHDGRGAGELVRTILDDWSRRRGSPPATAEAPPEFSAEFPADFREEANPPPPPEESPPTAAA